MRHSLTLGWAEMPLPNGVGLDLTGFLSRDNPSTGQRDPLFARAVCLNDGATKLVWVSVDVLALGQALVDRARIEAASTFRLPPRAFCIAATHTHSAPAAIFLANCGVVDREWVQGLEGALLEVMGRAIRDATRRVYLRFARVDAPGFVYNRRTHRRDGSLVAGADHNGSLDPALSVVVAHEERTDRPCAAIVHYACHPVFFRDRLLSADWPGRMIDGVLREMGPDFRCLFIQGAGADVNPLCPAESPEANAARMGDGLAGAALELIADAQRGTRLAPALNSRLRMVSLPWRGDVSEETLRGHLLSPAEWTRAERAEQAWHIWARRVLVARSRGWWADGARMPVQVFSLGELAVVAFGAETFTQTNLDLQAAHQSRPLIVASYANDAVGYLPPADEIPRGGYEVDAAYRYYGLPDRYASEAEALARQAVTDILKVGTMGPRAR